MGGYLQQQWGWPSNFYLLGILTAVVLVFELKYSGESLQTLQPFHIKVVANVYRTMLGTVDFSLGLVSVGLSYSLLVIYGMVSPFIIETVYGFTPVVTGYSSLLSGASLMLGGIISKLLINRPLVPKLKASMALQLTVAVAMCLCTGFVDHLYGLLSVYRAAASAIGIHFQ